MGVFLKKNGYEITGDGWYLPDDKSKPAIILETKAETEDIFKEKWERELLKNVTIVETKYTKTIGLLYNGKDVRVFKNQQEMSGLSNKLEHKSYYLKLFSAAKLDKNHIYEVTQRINNGLHFKFGMTDLQDRMIFTACALVAQRYNPKNGLQRLKDMDYSAFHNWIYSTSDGFPHVTTSGINNGISYYVENPMFDGNCITVASDGAMGASFYQ